MSGGEANSDAARDNRKGRTVSDAIKKEPEAYSAHRNSAIPSHRDFQEYIPIKLPFYYPDRAVNECEYPYEIFTHQSYCTLVNVNRMSAKRALAQEYERKRSASRGTIKAEIKQLMDVKAFQPVHLEGISEQTKRKIIPSHMFLKEKTLAI
jgi:hypothetical protein